MQNLENTQYFKLTKDNEVSTKEILRVVYDALVEKGYSPSNQIVGYIMSGDPTFITSHKGARRGTRSSRNCSDPIFSVN